MFLPLKEYCLNAPRHFLQVALFNGIVCTRRRTKRQRRMCVCKICTISRVMSYSQSFRHNVHISWRLLQYRRQTEREKKNTVLVSRVMKIIPIFSCSPMEESLLKISHQICEARKTIYDNKKIRRVIINDCNGERCIGQKNKYHIWRNARMK